MEGKVYNNQFEERENSSSDNSGGGCSPPSTARPSISISSPKTRRGIQKKVVTIPIKGDYTTTTPPSDAWAWRKYGQKPIKGSPYPRGYYRCSSSKGCPARKQVERSHTNPTLLLVTYSYEHNHSFPVSRHHPNTSTHTNIIANNTIQAQQPLIDDKFEANSLITTVDEFDWTFSTMETTSSAILDDPIFSSKPTIGHEYLFPTMGYDDEEEESLFADLGELPECSVVRMRSF